jgi:hypothetical protein
MDKWIARLLKCSVGASEPLIRLISEYNLIRDKYKMYKIMANVFVREF